MELFENGGHVETIDEQSGAARTIGVREEMEKLEAAGIRL